MGHEKVAIIIVPVFTRARELLGSAFDSNVVLLKSLVQPTPKMPLSLRLARQLFQFGPIIGQARCDKERGTRIVIAGNSQ